MAKTSKPARPASRASDFVPPRLLRNPHLMTIVTTFWPRRFPALPPAQPLLVEVAPETRVRLDCHWQPEPARHPSLLLLHGLEGSSDSGYMRGTADKAWRAGFNAIRMNVRNCGGTETLTPSLYHSGLSDDVAAVVRRLLTQDHLPEIHLAGFSMGGNTVLKLAGEWGTGAPAHVRSVSAVCPSLDLARCADAIHLPSNFLYEWRFLFGLRSRYRRKSRLFPQLYRTDGLARVHSVREFDDRFTAPAFGFGTAANYYTQASALRVAARIALPTLVVAAQDDPFIPFESFLDPALTNNSHVTLLAPRHGGHVGFLSSLDTVTDGTDRFWAEQRVVDFTLRHSSAAP